MALVKGRTCAESCLDLLAIEVVRFYYNQDLVTPEVAIEAIGMSHCNPHMASFAAASLAAVLQGSISQGKS